MNNKDYLIAVGILYLRRMGVVSPTIARAHLMSWKLSDWNPHSLWEVIEKAGGGVPHDVKLLSSIESMLSNGIEMGISPIPLSSNSYPSGLIGIEDAPPILFVRGNIASLYGTGVSVVGSRKATPHGLEISRRISHYLSSNAITVVSGLALGIDAAAHEGALLGNTPTIAVLAHGLEKAQPVTNQFLGARILEAGGAWVSEHEPGTRARPEYFVLRNRIQVGLSTVSVIVEGEASSGSKTQAEFCLRNNRRLYAVLSSPESRISTLDELPKILVNQRGASPIFSRSDYEDLLTTARTHLP